eukprot:3909034-Prymnesium_polylepis.1
MLPHPRSLAPDGLTSCSMCAAHVRAPARPESVTMSWCGVCWAEDTGARVRCARGRTDGIPSRGGAMSVVRSVAVECV